MRLDRTGRYSPGERGCSLLFTDFPFILSPSLPPFPLASFPLSTYTSSRPLLFLCVVSSDISYFAKSIARPINPSKTIVARTNEDERHSGPRELEQQRRANVDHDSSRLPIYPPTYPPIHLSTQLTAENEIYPVRNAFYAAYGCIPWRIQSPLPSRALSPFGFGRKDHTSRPRAVIDLRASTLQAMNSEKPVGVP